ncbi:GAF domain-containing protein [Anabaena sphaerica FACHB-251]|uniref:Circadian input-output histidine kinase CikA n=1 Tax=Anabaena sphaerica FACHB-251 TaxID=2692883 RepID=A0A926WKW5_9NOST|nr:ATP-binding protein [Anabaena sphaerica]MBD2296523.1 GAF domain-containing protein [Anabaena sphaerica FACHB-251]
MTITANNQLSNLFSQNQESINRSTDGLLPTLASELVYTQDGTGRYLTFDWQHSELLDLETEKIVDALNENEAFTPVDKVTYLERLHRILTTLVPERVQCWFKSSQQLFELELTITPIMPRLGLAATTVLVMGRLLPSQVNSKEVNQEAKKPSQLELALRSRSVPQVSVQNQKLLNKITRNIRRTLDLDIIWQQTVDCLGNILNLERCIICPYQPGSAKVQIIAEYHQQQLEPLLGSEIDISSEPAFAQALATLEPMVIELPIQKNQEQQKFLLVATNYQDQANGLVALSLSNEYQLLTETELELTKELADQLGTAIAHATLYKELEDARQKAEEASRLKSEFLANVSHEIRTPLNGMIGFLKLILEGMADDPEEQHQFVSEAHQLSIHLLNILNDILDIAKIEAGKMELDCSPVKLNELFGDVENFTRPQAEMRNLSLQMQMPVTSDEIIVQGNYQRLLQVMLNLVGNALKFTHEGGVTISADLVIKKSKGKSSKPSTPGMVKVRVADTGIGVSLDKQDKLFQLFSQVDGSRTRHYGGTGLGLTISQRLIEAMGGEVHFYSLGEGLGSTVTFTVPLYQQPVLCSPSECEIESQN